MKTTDTKQVRIGADFHRALKDYAKRHGMTIKEVTEYALKKRLEALNSTKGGEKQA